MARALAHASAFHAIADPTRRAILDLLREQDRTVSALMEELRAAARLTQSAFSQHLAVLRRAGLVVARKHGRERVYSFRAEPLAEVADWVHAYDRFWTEKLDNLGRYLDSTHGAAAPGPGGTRSKGKP